MFDSELPGSPEQVIGAFKDGKTTYAKIFECLCVYVKSLTSEFRAIFQFFGPVDWMPKFIYSILAVM